MPSRHLTLTQRNNFKRILSQLDKAKTDAKIVKIVTQASNFLREYDITWDAINLYIPAHYIFVSERKRAKANVTAAAKVATALHPKANGTGYPLGRDGRSLLKAAITKHPDWPLVSEQLGMDIGHATVADLIAVAQLLKLDDRFIAMFDGVTEPTQVEMFDKPE